MSADEIALFNLFTGIRRFGRAGPESILNAPGQQPILDVAIRTGFLWLADRPPHEVGGRCGGRETTGAGSGAGPPFDSAQGKRRTFTGEDFRALAQPGFAKATMNFRVTDLGNGIDASRYGNPHLRHRRAALRRFTPYWRIIFPGSSILRSTWLAAIKTPGREVPS